jgi:hypothetical protein
MLLYSDIIYFFVQMILHFQKEMQLCTFLKLKKNQIISFGQNVNKI